MANRSLITGVGGFVGQYLAGLLLERGDTVVGLVRDPVRWRSHQLGAVEVHTADLVNARAVAAVIDATAPERIYHLAADSSVGESFANPMVVFDNNVAATVNLLEAVGKHAPHSRILVVGSSEVYGRATSDTPVDEGAELRPENSYAVSKAAADLFAYQYYVARGVDVVRVRPFTHIGPGQDERFVAASFARQIADIERGARPPTIEVGNLEARRDFTDVRDMVRAYELAMLKGESGAVYNIGRGSAVSIRSLLEALLRDSRANIEVRIDPGRLRQIDAPVQICDARRFRDRTLWEPIIPLDQTLNDMLEYARAQLDAVR